ncbi:helix-turn-helix domain-containing protein [Streptomyces fuscichromogenes]|uniref:helix-turn-helix domain-containing protein n=1 Tax=Streptomyces fuscichromogenes TaxID=1324013 RepID=UPI00380EF7E7
MPPGRDKTAITPEAVWLGELIRTRRRGRFSIETLAQRAGISAGLLSEVERGKGNPSFLTLLKLAEALEMQPADFFRFNDSAWRDDHLVRKSERQRMSFPDGRVIEVLSPRLDLPVVMWKTVYPPGYDGRSVPCTVGAETSLVVARGSLVVAQQDGETWHLSPGDALRLEAGTVFGPLNPGAEAAETIEASSASPL